MNIWPAAIAWRVKALPGLDRAKAIGRLAIAAPSKTAAQTWGWTRLEAPAGVDVWLISWLPSQGTELHDHGASSAAFTVVAGTLTEIRPDDGRLVPQEFRAGRTQTVDPGDLHDVLNAGTEPAVSIHAYSSPLTRMTYWARDAEGTLVPTRTVETDEPETEA